MEPFLNVFFTIDKDLDEVITTHELKQYVDTNKMDDKMIPKWMALFDQDKNGRITLQEFCDVLGLHPKQARIYRTETFGQHSAPIRGLGSDVIVISANMALEDQIDISDEARRLIQPDQSSRVEERRLTGDLKRYLDTKYGRMWHVVVLNGSYWMNYSHEPQYSFQFRIGRYVILCWRTPAY